MKTRNPRIGAVVGCVLLLSTASLTAQDWPQWRGPNRDARATGFTAPKTWPKELTQQWKVTVGEGVATPALVGDKLYVFSREGNNEVTRCLEAGSGKEVWQDRYEAESFRGPDSRFMGPRSSPTVAEGKVVTLGVQGTLSCLDAATGKKVWRNQAFTGSTPRFHTASSPLIVDGLCIAQLGGGRGGAIIAFDLDNGKEKWKQPGDSPGYASPVLLTVGGTKAVVSETETKIVALRLADGKLLWETPYSAPRRGYNASTPMVDGQTLIYCGSGRGTKAVKITAGSGGLMAKELWDNPDNSVQFNTPVLSNGYLFGLSARNILFCINAEDGKTAWTTPVTGGGGGRRSRPGFGSVVAAGSVLFGLTPSGTLIVFEPTGKEFKSIASYKVASGGTYAYPVVSGKRIFIKDDDSVTLWTLE
jgi:outer membrane protein assembly factor BamB